jgi:hypothetical protein
MGMSNNLGWEEGVRIARGMDKSLAKFAILDEVGGSSELSNWLGI